MKIVAFLGLMGLALGVFTSMSTFPSLPLCSVYGICSGEVASLFAPGYDAVGSLHAYQLHLMRTVGMFLILTGVLSIWTTVKLENAGRRSSDLEVAVRAMWIAIVFFYLSEAFIFNAFNIIVSLFLLSILGVHLIN